MVKGDVDRTPHRPSISNGRFGGFGSHDSGAPGLADARGSLERDGEGRRKGRLRFHATCDVDVNFH